MGWCSGTDVFDPVAEFVLGGDDTDEKKFQLLKVLVKALYSRDWDCESDSAYYSHPIVQRVMRELNPDWDWDEISGGDA